MAGRADLLETIGHTLPAFYQSQTPPNPPHTLHLSLIEQIAQLPSPQRAYTRGFNARSILTRNRLFGGGEQIFLKIDCVLAIETICMFVTEFYNPLCDDLR